MQQDVANLQAAFERAQASRHRVPELVTILIQTCRQLARRHFIWGNCRVVAGQEALAAEEKYLALLLLYAKAVRLIISTNKNLLLDADQDSLENVFITGNLLFFWARDFKSAAVAAVPCRMDVQGLVLEALTRCIDTRPNDMRVREFERKCLLVLAYSCDILQDSYFRTGISVQRIADYFADKVIYSGCTVKDYLNFMYKKLPVEDDQIDGLADRLEKGCVCMWFVL
jgi:hypothetical protein